MHSTTVLSSLPANSLNRRTEVAHTLVSTLGKMFSTLRLPAWVDSVTSDKSPPTRLKAGAVAPTAGNWPSMLIGWPLNVTLDIAHLMRGRIDRKSTRLKSSHYCASRLPSSACRKKHV